MRNKNKDLEKKIKLFKKKLFEKNQELKIIYKITQSIHSLELDILLAEIVDIAIKTTKADSCLIYILEPKKKELVLRASKNPHTTLLKKIKMKLGEGITGWVAKEKKPVVISQGARKDKRFKYFRSLPEDKFEAFLSVPIINKQGVVGVINVQHKKKYCHLKREINLLSAIGKLVGGAVENALLIEESLLLKEALEIRKLVDKARGILMKKNNLSEQQAYRAIQKESMNSRKTLKDVSEAIILAEKLKLST